MHKNNLKNWSILLILSMVWGSSFILMKKSLIVFSHLEVAFLRLLIAFIILSPFFISSIKKLKKKNLAPLTVVSIIGTVIPAILFANSQIYINSSLSGMLNALTPIFTLMVGVILFKNRNWSKNNILGTFIGIIGTFILISPSYTELINIKYSLLIVVATLFYAISINTIKEKLYKLNSIDIAVLTSFFSAIISIIYIITNDPNEIFSKINNNISFFYYLLILGTFCTSFAIILFNYLIKKTNALFASSTTYLIPIFAIIWGIIDYESIYINQIIGVFVILIGIGIMNKLKVE